MNPPALNVTLYAPVDFFSPLRAFGHWRGKGLLVVLAVHLRRTNRPGVVPGLISKNDISSPLVVAVPGRAGNPGPYSRLNEVDYGKLFVYRT